MMKFKVVAIQLDLRRLFASSANVHGLDASRIRPFLDFTKPSSWYPGARSIKRRVICHVGPTNSGKTYSALQELLRGTGRRIYCAPLRLLAIEMFERLNRQWNLPCSLRTGEITCGPSQSVGNVDFLSDSPATSCTVEMVDINNEYDVAIIDEIQMMADPQRGWAFTQALLGLQARTLFLCGEEAALPLIQELCRETGDSLEIRRFERLSPLEVSRQHLGGDLKRIQPGDCVVTFSRRQIFDLKAQIERRTSRKCAVVYGNLPMESRSQQARLFNESGSEYNVLVASDAIGMGLNLNIKRIIFHTMKKYNGFETELMAPNQVKQIAGRAGRFGTDHEGGIAMTMQKGDTGHLQDCMRGENASLRSAGLLPSPEHVVNLSAAFPELSLPSIIDLYRTEAQLGQAYFLCQFRDIHKLAGILQDFPTLSMQDRFKLACAPVKTSDESVLSTFISLVKDYSEGLPPPLRISIPRLTTKNPENCLMLAESVYRSLDLYLWLGTHFPSRFLQIREARMKREECGRVVDRALELICHVRGAKRRQKQNMDRPVPVPEGKSAGSSTIGLADIDRIIDDLDRHT